MELPSDGKFTRIGERAFGGNTRIKSMTVSENIKEILFGAFEGAVSLERIVLSDVGTVIVKDRAFMKCRNLSYVENMSTIISYGNKAFMGCERLVECDINQLLVRLGKSCFEGCKSISMAVLPILHKEIPARAFCECESLACVKMPPSLEIIGEKAFFGCISLNEIDFVDTLKVIGASAFEDCYSLPKVSFGSDIKKIGKGAFKNCRYLHTIEFSPIGDRDAVIEKNAFSGCVELKTVVIPDGKWSVSPSAFEKCNLSSDDPLHIVCDDEKTLEIISRQLKSLVKKGAVAVLSKGATEDLHAREAKNYEVLAYSSMSASVQADERESLKEIFGDR